MIGFPELEATRGTPLFAPFKRLWDNLVSIVTSFRVGTVTLLGATTPVSCNAVLKDSRIFLQPRTAKSLGTLEIPPVKIIEGVSFQITSSSATDTSTVDWLLVNLK